MTYSITEVKNYDNKRNKVTLDYGEVTFLLYKGECRRFGIRPNEQGTLEENEFRIIMEEILIPRAKKKILYYLKNADKTRNQIRQKLREGFYPEEVIEQTFAFLDKYGFADDDHYAEEYIEEQRGRRSRREIEMKLAQRGISGSELKEKLAMITEEDELLACQRAFDKKYPHGMDADQSRKAMNYLAGKGFSFSTIQQTIA